MSTPDVPDAPGDDIRITLQRALRAAMKSRDTVAVSALRSALAAIANAEAVPAPAPRPSRAGGTSPARPKGWAPPKPSVGS
jgi:hypothetical protein